MAKPGCDYCRNGIMSLEAGLPDGRKLRAPCVQCSPNRRLSDLEAAEDALTAAEELEREREAIRAHNARVEASAKAGPP